MLEQPDLPDEKIIECLHTDYALRASQIDFLPLGADQNTAVYRVVADTTPYFVKLRSGAFDETAVALPKFLSDQTVSQIMAPVPTQTGALWANLADYTLCVYPFIDGRNGYEVDLSDQHWIEFGAALKRLHTANIPAWIIDRLPRETYSSHWRDIVKMFLPPLEITIVDDPVARQTAAFLQVNQTEIQALLERTGQLAQVLQAQPPECVVCHGDLHAGNILIDAHGALYIVDWDTLIFAPKERDLMYAGGGQFGKTRTAREEETLFYRGYGPTTIDPIALAYYRFERIIEDIAVECQQIFLTTDGGEDRKQELRFLMSNFEPGGVLAIAYASTSPLREVERQLHDGGGAGAPP